MSFGNLDLAELVMTLLVYALPFVLLVWLVRTLTSIAVAQREIAARLASIDEHLRSSERGGLR